MSEGAAKTAFCRALGKVRAQLTILEECWRPSFARSLVPKITALRRDLDEYLAYYNFDRAHTGRLTKGRVPRRDRLRCPQDGSRTMSGCHHNLGIGQPSLPGRVSSNLDLVRSIYGVLGTRNWHRS
jgi:hypothetical protein